MQLVNSTIFCNSSSLVNDLSWVTMSLMCHPYKKSRGGKYSDLAGHASDMLLTGLWLSYLQIPYKSSAEDKEVGCTRGGSKREAGLKSILTNLKCL